MIRNVDAEKCIGCGTCQKTCPLDVFRLKVGDTGSACAAACPLHNEIREIQSLLQLGFVEKAAELLWVSNPLGAITGRVCAHFCESKCARGTVDRAVNICGIERFLGDLALQLPIKSSGAKHVTAVAIVGSGPAGLACAADLVRQGFQVDVYEAEREPGGMLRYGIPEYRLPPAILASLMNKLENLGVRFYCEQRLGLDFTIQDLKEQGYGAIFVALGASKARQVAVEGVEGTGIDYGLSYLRKVRTREIRSASKSTVVIGGGDVALDVAQTLVRLGADQVTVISLEAEHEMPALRHNLEESKALGILFIPSAGVKRVLRSNGKLCGLELMPCIRVFDNNGRFAPELDHQKTWQIDTEQVIFAIGQECILQGLPAELGQRVVQVNAATGQTAVPYIFAAGDLVSGPSTVAAAIGGGLQAAKGISLFIKGGDLATLQTWNKPVPKDLSEPAKLRLQKRHDADTMQLSPKTRNFMESSQGLTLMQALSESNRCLTCGSKAYIAHPDDCMTCFTCELYCPSGAIYVHPIKEDWPRALAALPQDNPSIIRRK